jgi:DNA repair protein RecN (Recombination protein N)
MGTDKAVVEAMFDVSGNTKVSSLLRENDIEGGDELILRREVSAKGQSRCFVNDSPATITLQKQIGDLLVDLHGQHEHQSLLNVESHILMLDDFGGLDGMVADFQTAFRKLKDLSDQLSDLKERERHLQEKREFYRFQMQEIDAVAPQAGEEQQLETELKKLENAEKLFETTGRFYDMLYGGEHSIHDQLVIIRNQLHDLLDIDRQFEGVKEECASAVAIVAEVTKFIQSYNAQVEFNPARLETLRDRLGRLNHLKKKYGGSLETLLDHRHAIGEEVALAENFDGVKRTLERDVERIREDCAVLAARLSSKRKDIARKMDRAIVAELARLGIQNGKFSTSITLVPGQGNGVPADGPASLSITMNGRQVGIHSRGCDRVEFFISTNMGEDVKPLARVASGGEISRIMLALKSILAKSDRLPVLIFDEIDVGVSGRIAQSVGVSLKSLSSFHQVLAITHLPQIAGLADMHFAVYKSDDGVRAHTSIRKLTLDERIHEVAKLMSGAEVTEAGLMGAKELMGLRSAS